MMYKRQTNCGKKAGEHLTVSGMVAAERFGGFTQLRSDFFFNVPVKLVDSNNKKNSDQPHP